MTINNKKTAVVVGSGPNGLAAAITLARAGVEVTIYEKNDVPGGACRSIELIRKGCLHDMGSAVHALALVSSFFKSFSPQELGLKWVLSPVSLAHPLDDGTAVLVSCSLQETASSLDKMDEQTYINWISPLVSKYQVLINEVMQFPKIPFRHPFLMLKFGLNAISSAQTIARTKFRGEKARALLAGIGAHSIMKLEDRGSYAAGMMLNIAAHTSGWVIPEGGAQRVTEALLGYFKNMGGKLVTGHEIELIDQLSSFDIAILDITPRQFLKMAGHRLPGSYVNKLKQYKYGSGAFKIDWLLNSPIPWKASGCNSASTVHVGGSFEEIAAYEREVQTGRHAEKPFVFLVQPSLYDSTRSKTGEHIAWAYCHVPNDSDFDMTDRIESQVERFAPGFKKCINSRHVMKPADMEADNPNCVGGDVAGGVQSLKRLLIPPVSYRTPLENVFLCSSSTPPSMGVHGMCGYRAALKALKK